MLRRILLFIIILEIFIFTSFPILNTQGQEKKTPVEIPSSKADFYIQSVDQKHFGTGLFILDLNNDGVRDIGIVQGMYQSDVFWGKNRLFLFDGCTLSKETPTSTTEAKILLIPKTAKWKLFRREGVTDEGFLTGDFNGDGCNDILFALDIPGMIAYSFYLILGSPDFFDKLEKKRLKEHYHKFAQVKIFHSKYGDFDESEIDAVIILKLFDINGDQKDDIIITSTTADFKQEGKKKIVNTGKIFIILGKEEPAKEIDLSKDADIIIVGDTKKANLGSSLFAFKNIDEDTGDFKGTELFISQAGKIFCIPNIEQLSGQYTISKVPDVINFSCEGNVAGWKDINGDSRKDLIVETPFSYKFRIKMADNDPLRYKTYKKEGVYPLLTVIYGRDEVFESGQHIDNIADIVISFKPKKDTEEMSLIDIGDLDNDGSLDAIFLEDKKKEGIAILHFVDNFIADGKYSILDETIDFSISLTERGFIPFFMPANFNGNEIPEVIGIEPFSAVKSTSPPGKLLQKCGKIYIYFDRPVTKESLANLNKENADLIICGEQEKEEFGNNIRIKDIDGDGIADLIVQSPWRDLTTRGKKNDAGAVYIFLGKSLWDFVKAEKIE